MSVCENFLRETAFKQIALCKQCDMETFFSNIANEVQVSNEDIQVEHMLQHFAQAGVFTNYGKYSSRSMSRN